MKQTFFLLALLAIAPVAHAWDCTYWHQWTDPKGECYQPPPTTGSAQQQQGQQQTQTTSSEATAAQAQAQAANATGGDAKQSQAQDANNVGNTLSTSSYYSNPRQTPPALSGYVEPTIACANARNGGASSPVAGISFGFSTKDKDCDLREDARLLYEFGQPRLAVELLCADARKRGLKDCTYTPPIAHVVIRQDDGRKQHYVTEEELRTVLERILERTTSK